MGLSASDNSHRKWIDLHRSSIPEEDTRIQTGMSQRLIHIHQIILGAGVIFFVTYLIVSGWDMFALFTSIFLPFLMVSFAFARRDQAEVSAFVLGLYFFLAIFSYIAFFDDHTFDIFYYALIPFVVLIFFVRPRVTIPTLVIGTALLVVLGLQAGFRFILLLSYPGLFLTMTSGVIFVAARYVRQTERDYYNSQQKTKSLQQESYNLVETRNLTTRMAHDFNNILSSISLNAELISMNLAKLDEASGEIENLEIIKQSVETGNELVKSLFSYSDFRSEVSIIDVEQRIEQVLPILRILTKRSTEIEFQVGSKGLMTEVLGTELEQVLINLVKNGDEAIHGKGSVTIKCDQEIIGREEYIRIRISDTGEGMDEETLDKLFELRFTTKEYGTGIGLNSVGSIVRKYHGKVVVESTPGKGSTFDVYFPASHVSPS